MSGLDGLTKEEWDLLQRGLADSGDNSEAMQRLRLKIHHANSESGCLVHKMSMATGICKKCKAQIHIIRVH